MFSAAETSPREAGSREGPSRPWYLIARREGNRLEVLTLAAQPRGETLPVFTSAGAARGFLRRGGAGEDWRARESSAGELISLLVGHLPRVDRIVVDPVFGVSAGEAEPPSASKQEFVAALMGERSPRAERLDLPI
jgi:hypothetical protein